MNEEYLKQLFESLGGSAELGGEYQDWSSSIATNDEYKKSMYENLGGESTLGGSYDEWNSGVFGDVKKKTFQYLQVHYLRRIQRILHYNRRLLSLLWNKTFSLV